MSSLPSALDVGPISSSTSNCLFLKVLPLEIRQSIYQYLLASRYTRHELNAKSQEYDLYRECILEGPDYEYCFHPSILGANKQIREEALEVFERESQFVGLLLETTELQGFYRPPILSGNVTILARGARAWAFPNVGLDIDFQVDKSPACVDPENRVVCVIPIEDLPAACAELQKKIRTCTRNNRRVIISLRGYDRVPTTKQARFLEPLWQLRGASFGAAEGLGWPSLEDTASAMRCHYFSVNETMGIVGTLINEGDEATVQGKPELAIARYKAALNTIRGSAFDQNEEEELLVGGCFNGSLAGWARDDSIVRLHSLLADSYLRLGHPRLARVYVERIYGPLYHLDHRNNREKFPLEIPRDHNPGVYAELLAVASKISIMHGNFGQAWAELREAEKLDGHNKDVQRQIEELDAVHDERYLGLVKNKKGRKRNIKARYHASLQVAANRIAKGDQASLNKNFQLARFKYEAAYNKIQATVDGTRSEYPSPPFYSKSCKRASAALTIEVLPKLTETCLELGEFENVHRWADKIISRSCFCSYAHDEPEGWDFVGSEPHIPEGVVSTGYYCKAVAFLKQGGPDALDLAMTNFEQALVYNAGCHASYYQLKALIEIKEAEEESLGVWEKMLRLEWDGGWEPW